MQYGQFEKALVEVFSIKEDNLGAFRARLRHLRSLGVPEIPKRGSGNTAIYKAEDLLATFVALALQTLGSTPTISAEIAKFAIQHFGKLRSEAKEIFLVVTNTSESRGPSSSNHNHLVRLKAPPGVRSMFLTTNPVGGGTTSAFMIVGAEEAGKFATNARVLASSMINLSARFEALPGEV
jgi:hypothetical protein